MRLGHRKPVICNSVTYNSKDRKVFISPRIHQYLAVVPPRSVGTERHGVGLFPDRVCRKRGGLYRCGFREVLKTPVLAYRVLH